MIWIQAVSVHSEDEEEYLDIYNMKKYARKVTIGQPSTSKEDCNDKIEWSHRPFIGTWFIQVQDLKLIVITTEMKGKTIEYSHSPAPSA